MRLIKEGKAMFLLSSLIMTSFQKRIAKQLGVKPGAEMIEGIDQAKAINAELVLADRDIRRPCSLLARNSRKSSTP